MMLRLVSGVKRFTGSRIPSGKGRRKRLPSRYQAGVPIPEALEPGPTNSPAELTPDGRALAVSRRLGPGSAELFFKLRLIEEALVHIRLTSASSVAGLQIIRSAEDAGTAPLGELARTSTLVHNPVVCALLLPAGCYVLRVYNFFKDCDDFQLAVTPEPVRAESDSELIRAGEDGKG